MTDIGVEVGQKMRSAIKAKLTELDCYVDDELPDYIMVMIANKRTKSQMKDDLQLFLASKTNTFVDWLHIVLKKLKEVHVTNPEVFKKPPKRKSNELQMSEEDLKKVKKEKKEEAKALKKARKDAKISKESQKSLTDDLPITANKLSEMRKIVVMQENQLAQSSVNEIGAIDEDSFDIPLLSEISASNEEELEMIEKKIKNVKSRLGLHVDSDDEDCLNIKPDPDDLLLIDQLKKTKEVKLNLPTRKIIIEELEADEESHTFEEESQPTQKSIHSRITFDKEKDSLNAKYAAILEKHKEVQAQQSPTKKKSILERLGKRKNEFRSEGDKRPREDDRNKMFAKNRNNNRDEKSERIRQGIMSRLGVMSKVSIPVRRARTPEKEIDEEEEMKMTLKEVPSVIKIKPRILPPKTKQANPSLLLKAMAEAQRSIIQAPLIKNKSPSPEIPKQNDSTALFTKKYKEKMENKGAKKAKILEEDKNKLKNFLTNINETAEEEKVEEIVNQKFIVTLDGVDKMKFASTENKKSKRTPSPIIFEGPKLPAAVVPEKLPIVATPVLKNKERCKYWPGCRHGEKCEFAHPTLPCKMFPNCKFEDKCLYVHPSCKFEASCTRRDCPYSHSGKTVQRVPVTSTSGNIQKPLSQVCKFFPNCSNPHCTFYHPRLCKYGVYCKNQNECNFVHSLKPGNLTWRSEHK